MGTSSGRMLRWDVLRTSYFNVQRTSVEDVLRTSAGDVPWRYIEDHMGTSIGRLLGTSSGRNFAEWDITHLYTAGILMHVFLFAIWYISGIRKFRRFVLHECFQNVGKQCFLYPYVLKHHQLICLWEKLYTFVDLSCNAMIDEIQCHLKMFKRLKINDSNY